MNYIHTPISALARLEQVKAIYLIKDYEKKFSRNKDSYFLLTLADATGSVKGLSWTFKDVNESIIGKYLAIEATVNNKTQLKIHQAKILDRPLIDIVNYQPGLPSNVIDVYWYEILETIKLVEDEDLKNILTYVFHNESIDSTLLKISPTEKILMRGGLLHNLYYGLRAIVRLHDVYAGSNIKLDKDYLITAWLLSRIDTPSFYKIDSPLFEKTEKGYLLDETICNYAKVQQLYIAVESFISKEISTYKKNRLNHLLLNTTSDIPETIVLNTVNNLEIINGRNYYKL